VHFVEIQIHDDVVKCLRENVPCRDLDVGLRELKRKFAVDDVTLWAYR